VGAVLFCGESPLLCASLLCLLLAEIKADKAGIEAYEKQLMAIRLEKAEVQRRVKEESEWLEWFERDLEPDLARFVLR
jgi:hypothetical protein